MHEIRLDLNGKTHWFQLPVGIIETKKALRKLGAKVEDENELIAIRGKEVAINKSVKQRVMSWIDKNSITSAETVQNYILNM